jgi:4-amino-4-deoxy-L-arabinose transferase-like glycosyltransferase
LPKALRVTDRTALWLLILLATAVRLAMAHAIGLGVDESYMVAAGRTLRWGYFDHPPIAWWLSWGAAHLFGSEAPVVVRLPFVLLGAASTWMVARLGTDLADRRAGLWAALAFTCAPVLGFTSASWVLPDGPLDAALLAMALCLVRALRWGGWGWWLGSGLFAGLALMSKYTAVLTLAGALVYLLTQPGHRRWLARPQPWVAGLLALAVFSPVVLWNAEHGWASLAFQGARAEAVRLQIFGPLVVLGGEALFLLPWIWAPLMLAWVRALRRGPADRTSWLLCCLGAPPILLFCVVALWSRHVLFHWAAPGYLLLLPLLGAALARREGPLLRRVAAGTVALLLAGLAVVALEVRWNPLKLPKDVALEAVDLTPLRGVLAARGLLGQPIAATSWSETGKIDYALGGHPVVLCLNTDARQYGFAPGPAAHLGQDVLIVAPRADLARIRASYGARFASITPLPPAVVDLPGRPGHAIALFLGHDLRQWP